METITKSAAETKEFGKRFSASLKGGEVLALVGELGSGKTTFVQGLVEGLGGNARVSSPTFVIMREYDTSKLMVYHLDFYRISENVLGEARNLGLPEIMSDGRGVVVIEWAERLRELLPSDTKWIDFNYEDEDKRKINVR